MRVRFYKYLHAVRGTGRDEGREWEIYDFHLVSLISTQLYDFSFQCPKGVFLALGLALRPGYVGPHSMHTQWSKGCVFL